MQKEKSKTEIWLSQAEIGVLLKLSSAEKVYGLPQETIIPQSDVGDKTYQIGLESLTAKGFVMKHGDRYEISPAILPYIFLFAFPQKVVTIHYAPDLTQPSRWRYYFSGHKTLAIGEIDYQQYSLNQLHTYQTLQEHLQDRFPISRTTHKTRQTLKLFPNQVGRLQLFFGAKQLGVIGRFDHFGRLESCGFVHFCTISESGGEAYQLSIIAEDERGSHFLLSLNMQKSTLDIVSFDEIGLGLVDPVSG